MCTYQKAVNNSKKDARKDTIYIPHRHTHWIQQQMSVEMISLWQIPHREVIHRILNASEGYCQVISHLTYTSASVQEKTYPVCTCSRQRHRWYGKVFLQLILSDRVHRILLQINFQLYFKCFLVNVMSSTSRTCLLHIAMGSLESVWYVSTVKIWGETKNKDKNP